MARVLALLALAGCAHVASGPPGFGLSKGRAAEVCLPPGEKAYLGKLLCEDGSRPRLTRAGNVGTRMQPIDPNDPRILLQMDAEVPIKKGEADLHIVEAVEAECGPTQKYTLYIDVYHCPAQGEPPPPLPPPPDHFKM
jgi:hypothetical protein